MLGSSFPIALFSGVSFYFLLFIAANLFSRKLSINKDDLVNYLKEALSKDEYKEQRDEYKQWFEYCDKRFKKEEKNRKHKTYAYIFIITLNIFLIIELISNISLRRETRFLPPALIPLPILIFSFFFLMIIIPVFSTMYNKSGTILNKINLSVYIIFPRIKKRLIFYTHEPIPSFYGDPRIIESFYYLKKIKNKTVKLYWYFSRDASEMQKKSIIERLLSLYEKKGLLDIIHFLEKKEDFQHFVLGDNSLVRIEKKHAPWITSYPKLSDNFPNNTYYFNPVLAIELKSFLKKIEDYDLGSQYY